MANDYHCGRKPSLELTRFGYCSLPSMTLYREKYSSFHHFQLYLCYICVSNVVLYCIKTYYYYYRGDFDDSQDANDVLCVPYILQHFYIFIIIILCFLLLCCYYVIKNDCCNMMTCQRRCGDGEMPTFLLPPRPSRSHGHHPRTRKHTPNARSTRETRPCSTQRT